MLMREESGRLLMLVAKHLYRLVHGLFSLIDDGATLDVSNAILFVVNNLEVGEVLVIVQVPDELFRNNLLARLVQIVVTCDKLAELLQYGCRA